MNGSMSVWSAAWNLSADALTLAISAGLNAAFIGTVVLAINVVFRRWLSSRQMALLWGIVLVRLLIPAGPPSHYSLETAWLHAQQAMIGTEQTSALPNAVPHREAGPYRVAEFMAADFGNAARAGSSIETASQSAYSWIDFQVLFDAASTLLPIIWMTGGCVYLTRTMIAHWQLCKKLARAPSCADARLRSICDECRKVAGVRQRIEILPFDEIQHPAILGVLRPRLLLPSSTRELSDQQLQMIMLHELAHVRYLDVAANWGLVLLRAIHWWNPVFWLAAGRFQNLREQACDAFAVQKIDARPAREYSELLLALAQRQSNRRPWRVKLPASILGFFSGYFRKRAVQSRLEALRSAAVIRGRWQPLFAAGLILVVAFCGLTDASAPAADGRDTQTIAEFCSSSNWLPQSGQRGLSWQSLPSDEPGPYSIRRYDVKEVLDRMTTEKHTRDQSCLELKTMVELVMGSQVRADASLPAPIRAPGESAQQNKTGSVRLYGESLIVDATSEVHDEILQNLRIWKESGAGQISIEARFLTADRDIASAVGVSWQYLEAFSGDTPESFPVGAGQSMPVIRAKASVDDYLPITVARLEKHQVATLINVAQGDRRANVLQAPKVTVFNGMRFFIMDCTQSPFVVGVEENPEGVVRPKIAVIDEGTKLSLRARQRADSSQVRLEGRFELSSIGDVRTTSAMRHGQLTTIQIPQVKRCRIDVASEVDDGKSLLIACIPSYDKKQFFYLLLTVRVVEAG